MENKAERALLALRKKEYSVSAAESCTGGLVLKTLTDIAGCSDVVFGGVVSYSNSVKERALGVSHETLEKYGAVSEQTAREMCLGVRKLTSSDLAVSTTGIAGPGGGSAEKPVGTVCFGICTDSGVKTFTCHFDSSLSRDKIRAAALDFALGLIIDECE